MRTHVRSARALAVLLDHHRRMVAIFEKAGEPDLAAKHRDHLRRLHAEFDQVAADLTDLPTDHHDLTGNEEAE